MSHIGTTVEKDFGILSDIFSVAATVVFFFCLITCFWVSVSAMLMIGLQMSGGKGDFRSINGAGAVIGFLAICGFIANPLVFLIVWFIGIYTEWYTARRAAAKGWN